MKNKNPAHVSQPVLVPPSGGEALEFIGVTHKLTQEHTNGAYYLFEGVFKPQSGNRLHVHRYEDEVVHVLVGELEVRLQDRMFRTGAGGVAHLPRNIPHALYNPGQVTLRFLAIAIPGGMEKLFDELLAAQEAGTLTRESHNQISLKYGIEWLE